MIEILVTLAVLLLDQITKALSAFYLTTLPFHSYTLIDGVLNLTYVKNTGASFGMLSGARWFFIVLTVVACGFIIYFLIRERKTMHTFMKISVSLILSGALGNLIDRVFLGYVRDMIEPAFINFAIFNIADCAITLGVAFLMLDIFFLKNGKRFAQELEKRGELKKQAKKND
ncbi:MAG: signal peptidase II [Clostridia bacterium]|nr:signal peptidase II [Clostridia bacterium]